MKQHADLAETKNKSCHQNDDFTNENMVYSNWICAPKSGDLTKIRYIDVDHTS